MMINIWILGEGFIEFSVYFFLCLYEGFDFWNGDNEWYE